MSVACAACMNHVWRTIFISILNIVITSIILICITIYNSSINNIMTEILEARSCWKYNSQGQLNWTQIYNNTENSCVFIFLQQLFPGAIYAWSVTHLLSDIMLGVGAFQRSNVVLLVYLTIDSGHIGVMAAFWAISFLTERMPRMVLMIILFPLISYSLCAWMTIFGYYIRLEEKQWARIKRRKKKEKLENILTSEWIKTHSKEDLTDSMYDLCSSSIHQGRGQLPQQKSLEEILRQELAWTLEQIGEENEEDGQNSIHELATFTNEAFRPDEEVPQK